MPHQITFDHLTFQHSRIKSKLCNLLLRTPSPDALNEVSLSGKPSPTWENLSKKMCYAFPNKSLSENLSQKIVRSPKSEISLRINPLTNIKTVVLLLTSRLPSVTVADRFFFPRKPLITCHTHFPREMILIVDFL